MVRLGGEYLSVIQMSVALQQRGADFLRQGGVIDVAISPQQATISALLTHVRRADIVNVSYHRVIIGSKL